MEIIALVGPSGTGKSHRAILVSNELNIDLIIDDGLLIKGSRILAGISSKRQETKVGAIKTALFTDKEHAKEVKEAIQREEPNKILILGTSEGMVFKITQSLGLPQPKKIMFISDIATKEEIERASAIRKKYNKHVIPAPTVEVKPKLSGILSAPLQTIFSSKTNSRYSSHLKVEQTVVKPTFSFIGKFFIANAVLQQITEYSIKKFSEVEKLLKANFITTPNGVKIKVELSVFYGENLLKLGNKIQNEVKRNIEYMTALHIEEIEIYYKRMLLTS